MELAITVPDAASHSHHWLGAAWTADLPAAVEHFATVAGQRALGARAEHLARWVERCPWLQPYLVQRHSVELGFASILACPLWIYRRKLLPWNLLTGVEQDALILAAEVLGVWHDLRPEGRVRLRGQLRDGLQRRDGLLSVRFELRIATDLIRRGFQLSYVDLESTQQSPTFDFLARKGDVEIAVECRAFTWDAAKKIHRHDFWRLVELVLAELKISGSPPPPVKSRLRLTGRLPRDERTLREIASTVARATRSNQNGLRTPLPGDEGHVETDRLPLEAVKLRELHAAAVAEAAGGGHVMAIGDGKELGLIFSATSLRDKGESLPARLVRELRDKSRRQFADHPSRVLAVMLEDVDEADLPELAQTGALPVVATVLLQGEPALHSLLIHGFAGAGYSPHGLRLVFSQPSHPLAEALRLDDAPHQFDSPIGKA